MSFYRTSDMPKWNNFLSEQLLIEGRLQDTMKKYSEIDPEIIKQLSLSDPSGKNAYLMWMAQAMKDSGAGVYDVPGLARERIFDIVPIVKVNPQYPRAAAMRGTEGYVQLNVDIQKDGSVSNVRIVNSNPRRVFDRAAVRAASKYKYRPQIVDGKPTVLKNHGIQIDFKLDGN